MLPMFVLALAAQGMQSYAKERTVAAQLRTVNNARRMQAAARDQKRKGILGLIPGQTPERQELDAAAATQGIDAAQAAARGAGTAQFQGSQGQLDGISPEQQAQIVATANQRAGNTSAMFTKLQGRITAGNQRRRARTDILGQNALIDNAAQRQLGLLDGQLGVDGGQYRDIYQLGGLVGAVGTGVDAYGIDQYESNRAQQPAASGGGTWV